MERPINGDMLYVFAFVNSAGTSGLDDRTRGLLVPSLYKLLSVNCNAILDQMYEQMNEAEKVDELESVDSEKTIEVSDDDIL
jgi:hypothetical protein